MYVCMYVCKEMSQQVSLGTHGMDELLPNPRYAS